MKKINKEVYILLSAIILGASLISSSYIISNNSNNNSNNEPEDKKIEIINNSNDVMSLEETAEYLKMSNDNVLSIIKIEQKKLNKNHYFSGRMFPYFKIDNNYYIYKEELKDWLEESCIDRREYDTKSKTLMQ